MVEHTVHDTSPVDEQSATITARDACRIYLELVPKGSFPILSSIFVEVPLKRPYFDKVLRQRIPAKDSDQDSATRPWDRLYLAECARPRAKQGPPVLTRWIFTETTLALECPIFFSSRCATEE